MMRKWLWKTQLPFQRRLIRLSSTRELPQYHLETTAKPLPKIAQSMLHHIKNTQEQHPNAVVLTQVGSFMELYFNDAAKYGPLLNLKVSVKRQRFPGVGEVYMCGFPLSQKEKYERILVRDMGLNVVNLMQDSKEVALGGTEEAKRRVTRIITPGTLLGESFVDAARSNFLLSINSYLKKVSIMWVDIADGQIMYQEMDPAELGNALARVSPTEIVIDKNSSKPEGILEAISQYAPNAITTPYKVPELGWWLTTANPTLRFNIEKMHPASQKAFVGLMGYVLDTLPATPIDLSAPKLFVGSSAMQLDPSARKSLDLFGTSNENFARNHKTSLFDAIKRTKTPSGSRLLQKWLSAPLLNIDEINERHNKVRFLLEKNSLLNDHVRRVLAQLPDGARVLQKLRSTSVNPSDLISYAQSLVIIERLHSELLRFPNAPADWVLGLSQSLQQPLKLANYILDSINTDVLHHIEDYPALENSDLTGESGEEIEMPKVTKTRRPSTKGPGSSAISKASPASYREYIPIMKPEKFAVLSSIHEARNSFESRKNDIHQRLTKEYDCTVELRWSPKENYHVCLKSKSTIQPPPNSVISKTKTSTLFFDSGWSMLGNEMIDSSSKLRQAEESILQEMKGAVFDENLPYVRKAYGVCDEIDVISSFAYSAVEQNLVKPELVEDANIFDVKGGRHMSVEIGLSVAGQCSSGFVPNDCNLSKPKSICMITGPNMGGKSTYLRQNAIIALLAQTGSFVPAQSAKIGIVDRIYCRIGSGDDLYRGRSTFMVEMLETANILNTATDRSLAIIDEVGRGTSNSDGVAIAYAAIKHLALRNKCRVLFATHYGTELKQLLDSENDLMNCVQLLMAQLSVNPDGSLKFNYELSEGTAKSSCGLLIAELAGFPKIALSEANLIAEQHKYT